MKTNTEALAIELNAETANKETELANSSQTAQKKSLASDQSEHIQKVAPQKAKLVFAEPGGCRPTGI